MDFPTMQTFICNKVSKTDAFSAARCLEYIKARHKMMYEAFDWKAAQTLVTKTITAGVGTTTTLACPEVHHCISVRLDRLELDPVSPSFIFDRENTEKDELVNVSTASFTVRYYEEFLDPVAQVRSIRFFPPLADDGNNHTVYILGKTPYSDSWTSVAIPATESPLIAYATGDMWEYLHEVGKAQAKFKEAADLLQEAKTQDTPGMQRPRQMRRMTAAGNSLGEMRDTVCTLINDFSPTTRNTVVELIRRCWDQVWNAAAWPESVIVDMPQVDPVSGIAVLTSHQVDKVMGVRADWATNGAPPQYQELYYEDNVTTLGTNPQNFSQVGTPIGFNFLSPLGMPMVMPSTTTVQLQFTGGETQNQTISLRGLAGGVDTYETASVNSSPVTTGAAYDLFYTIHKPVTSNALQVLDMSNNVLMSLNPGEHSRKYIRIQIKPAFDTTIFQDLQLYVLGKLRVPQLLQDGDVAQLTGCENVLIYTAVSDYFAAFAHLDQAGYHSRMEQSQAFAAKAAAAMKTLIDRETAQQIYQPRVLPYVPVNQTRILL